MAERVHRVRRTVLQMLRDRGYMIDQADLEEEEEPFVEKASTPLSTSPPPATPLSRTLRWAGREAAVQLDAQPGAAHDSRAEEGQPN